MRSALSGRRGITIPNPTRSRTPPPTPPARGGAPRPRRARGRPPRDRLDAALYAEIRRRRAGGGGGEDLLSLLLAAEDEDGSRLDDRQVRDQAITLLFAGHDTTTSTVAFLLHLLDRHPGVAERLEAEQAELGERPPSPEELFSGLPELRQAVDETLRLYPPAWIGPRRAVRTFEFEGVTVPQGAPVNYSSYVSHRLADVREDPHEFRPERFTPERRAALPKGAYVPFGGGSRQCIGMRFGQLEVKAVAARVLREHRLELPPGHRLEVRQTPTLGPKNGLPMRVRGE
jgi:cytochrome P450